MSHTIFLALFSFFVYSTIFVVCNPDISSPVFESYSEICESFVLPLYHETHLNWHKASEKLMLDVLPYYGDRMSTRAKLLKQLTSNSIRNTFQNAFRQGSDAKLPVQKLPDPIHPLDPDAPKTASTRSLAPISDSATITRKMDHGSKRLRPILDAEQIMKNSNNKDAIDKTFPTVKPRILESTRPSLHVSAGTNTDSTEAAVTAETTEFLSSTVSSPKSLDKKEFSQDEASNIDDPETTTVDIEGESKSQNTSSAGLSSLNKPDIGPNNGSSLVENTVESATTTSSESASTAVDIEGESKSQNTSSAGSSSLNKPDIGPNNGRSFVENTVEYATTASSEFAATTSSESASTAIQLVSEINKTGIPNSTPVVEPSFENNSLEETDQESIVDSDNESTAELAQEISDAEIQKTQLPESQLIPQEEILEVAESSEISQTTELAESSIPNGEGVSADVLNDKTIHEAIIDVMPTPSNSEEVNDGNENNAPTESFSSAPPYADHVNLGDEIDSYESENAEIVED